MGVRTDHKEALAALSESERELAIPALEYIDACERHVRARAAVAEDRNQIAGEIWDARKAFFEALLSKTTEPKDEQQEAGQ